MIRHNILLTYRNYLRYKSSFLINLIGLSTGMACVLLIYLWVVNEIQTDRFFENDERLVQIMQNVNRTGSIETIEATPGILAKTLVEEIPEVERSVSVVPTTFNSSKGVVSVNDTHISTKGQYVSSDFFKVFSYDLLFGDKSQVLSEKNGVVISRELAIKLFQSVENVQGKTLDWIAPGINGLCIVSGVFESLPANATNRFDLLLNFAWFEESNPSSGWGNSSPRTFVLLKEGADLHQVNSKLKDFIRSKDSNSKSTLFIQRYSDRYLYGQYENGNVSGGRIEYIEIFSGIAIFILIIACINFMNLSTAKATRRLKEVGIKKAIGASRKSLVFQHLTESTLMAFLSLSLAGIFVLLFIPKFNLVTGKQLALGFDIGLILPMIFLTLVTGILAGSYPALYLSGFHPITVLKGKLNNSIGEQWTRQGLVIFQFTISVILIVLVLVVSQQIEYIQTRNPGYDREQVIYFRSDKMSDTFISEIKNIPGVVNAGGGNLEAGSSPGGTSGIEWEGKKPDDNTFFARKWASYDLLETLGMEMVAGQAFSTDFGSDKQIIFNEAAIENMQLDDPVGKNVKIDGEERQIVGIVKNFNFESFYEEIKPITIVLAPIRYAPVVSVRMDGKATIATLASIQKVFEKHNSDQVFDFRFMDDDYQKLYSSEKRVATLSKYFAGIAILISCLGLFGLAAFMAERRTKEIGIRKILGSSIFSIIRLLSADFTKMVLIAVAVALPLSFFIAKEWLDDFAYRIDLKWWFFLAAGAIALLIAWLTVGAQTLKAARINPVDCLRGE